MTDELTFVSDDPDLDAQPFTIKIEHRQFTGPEDEETGVRPSERVTSEFQCRPWVNIGVLAGIEAAQVRGSAALKTDAAFDLFDAALTPKDLPRFRKLVYGTDAYVDAKVLSQVGTRLYERYTARPTRSPAGS